MYTAPAAHLVRRATGIPPAGLSDLVMALLAKDPAQRPFFNSL